jgi:curved DNA-binding protein CbpA
MELSDYDILGITPKATFRIVKHAYYELSRIYHPDSPQILIGMTKEERLVAFQRVQKAYENIKEKLNVVEIDLPQEEIDYEDDKFDKPVIQKNHELCDFENENESDNENESKSETKDKFNEKFNLIFEKTYSQENTDNPFSLSYSEPPETKRNIQESRLTIKGHTRNDNGSNIHEFGINYVEDHSNENYVDIRHLENLNNSSNLFNNNENGIEPIKEEVDNDFDKKLEELIKLRDVNIEMTEEELNFMNRQKRIQKDIEDSKRKVIEDRNKLYLN